MGGSHSDSIKIATVNYSGITDSPFEFQSNDTPEIEKLNSIFKSLFHQLRAALQRHQSGSLEQIDPSSKNIKPLESKNSSSKRNPAENPIWRRFDQLGSAANIEIIEFMKNLKNEGKKFQHSIALTKQQQAILGKFDWGISHLDRYMHKGRYCPQYRENVGIQNGRFNSMPTFFSLWNFEFEKNKAYSKLNSGSSKKQRNVCLVYDYLIYKTIVEYCYHQYYKTNSWSIIPREAFQDGSRQKQSSKKKQERMKDEIKKEKAERRAILQMYESLLEKYHSMPYLNYQKKYQSLRKVIQENDVIFLQDISDQLLNALKGEGDLTIANRLGYNDDCCIVINNKRSKFVNIYDALKITDPSRRKKDLFNKVNDQINTQNPLYLSKSDFNYGYDDLLIKENIYVPAVCFIDNFLFLSLRFTSKPLKCFQIYKFFQHMLNINKAYPKLIIVIGGDFNCNLTNFEQLKDLAKNEKVEKIVTEKQLQDKFIEFNKYFYISNTGDTTNKIRSWLQSQSNKAGKQDIKQRDFLMSNHEIFNPKIDGIYINKNVKLPSKQHPFDHFFIIGVIKKSTNKKQKITNNG